MLAGEPQTDGRRPRTAHPGRRACPLGERRLQGDAGDRLPHAVRNRPSVSRAPRDAVRDPLKGELVRAGHRVAEYIPYGPNWLPYFTRRLRERPRNVITMVRSFVSG